MSGVTMTSEFRALSKASGIGLDDMEWLTTNAMKSAFAPFDERLEIINEGYARLCARQARVLANAPATAGWPSWADPTRESFQNTGPCERRAVRR